MSFGQSKHLQFPQQRLDLVPQRLKLLLAKEGAKQGAEAKVAADSGVVEVEVGGQRLLLNNPIKKRPSRKNHHQGPVGSTKDMERKHFTVCSHSSVRGSSISMIQTKVNEDLARLEKII